MELSRIMTSKQKTNNRIKTADKPKGKSLRSRATVTVGKEGRRLFKYQWWKSLIDFLLALAALVVLSPFMLLIAIIIKIDSRGEIIYHREQVGKDGRRFTGYKFRTMRTDNDDSEYKEYLVKYIRENAPYKVDHDGQLVYKVTGDPRVTRFGAILRKTNLDELPQLINVLRGEMSFVGPRPDIPFAVNMYDKWHRQRLLVKPGITGLWQVCGRRGLSFKEMVRLDIKYINRESLLWDAKIFVLTIGTILRGDGS
jgi:lipopolysaccharide/colanic/teichoic acid biosynthesis glycosyltransferase